MQWWVSPLVFLGGGLPFVLAEGTSLPMWLRLVLGGANAGIVALLGYVGRAPGTAKVEK